MVTGDDVGLSAVVWIRDRDAHRAHDTLGGAFTRAHPYIVSDANGGGDGRVGPHSLCPRWRAPPDPGGKWAWVKAKARSPRSRSSL
jgi:hypothetical protein